jgi:hypothetical protein
VAKKSFADNRFMIENIEQLDVALIQLGRLYQALASLRAKIPDVRQFALYAEGTIVHIDRIQAEIDEFTGRTQIAKLEARELSHESAISFDATAPNAPSHSAS